MGHLKGLIGACIGGAIGAAIWSAVALGTGYEVGWIAWGVGLLCGLGAMLLAQRDADDMTGIIAAVVALASIAAGKYLTVHALVKDFAEAGRTAITVDEGGAQAHMARDLVEEYRRDGRTLEWPEGKNERTAKVLEDFPDALRADLLKRWGGMSESARQDYAASVEALLQHEFGQRMGQAESEGFFASFSPLDLLFFFLAVATAYKVGTGDLSGGDDD